MSNFSTAYSGNSDYSLRQIYLYSIEAFDVNIVFKFKYTMLSFLSRHFFGQWMGKCNSFSIFSIMLKNIDETTVFDYVCKNTVISVYKVSKLFLNYYFWGRFLSIKKLYLDVTMLRVKMWKWNKLTITKIADYCDIKTILNEITHACINVYIVFSNKHWPLYCCHVCFTWDVNNYGWKRTLYYVL